MTWGCPKVGTFSFVARVHRVVPCSHRIATANDVITQLPFQTPLNAWTLRGWHHVGTEILLLSNGNMVLRPSPIESYMIHAIKSSVSAHFRLSYAIALAGWIIRSSPDMSADWWLSEIQQFTMFADLSPLPIEIREKLLWDLRRPGAPYFIGTRLVRDQAIDTELFFEETWYNKKMNGKSGSMTNVEDEIIVLKKFEERNKLVHQLIAARDDEEQFAETLKEYLREHQIEFDDDEKVHSNQTRQGVLKATGSITSGVDTSANKSQSSQSAFATAGNVQERLIDQLDEEDFMIFQDAIESF